MLCPGTLLCLKQIVINNKNRFYVYIFPGFSSFIDIVQAGTSEVSSGPIQEVPQYGRSHHMLGL